MSRRAVPSSQPRLTRRQLLRELRRIQTKLQVLGSAWDVSNGMLRYRIKRLERRLAKLLEQLDEG